MTKNDVEERIKQLLNKLTLVENNRCIYEELSKLCGKDKKYECVLKQNKCFWGMTISNLKSSLITELAKIFDEHNGSFGIKKVINICSQNYSWFVGWCAQESITHNELIQYFESQYAKVENERNKLKTIRDKYLAHNDKKYIIGYSELFDGFTWSNVEDLIEVAFDILATIWGCFTNTGYCISCLDNDDVRCLIFDAYKGMQNS